MSNIRREPQDERFHFTDESHQSAEDPPGEVLEAIGRRRIAIRRLLAVLVTVVAGRLAYDLVVLGGLNQSAVLYIGLPAVMATMAVLMSSGSKTFMATVMSSVTIALLLAVIVAGQWAICVLVSAPIFYLVAVLVGSVYRAGRSEDAGDGSSFKSAGLAVVPFLLLSLEGTPIGPSFEREETVSASAVVDATPAEVRAALAAPLRASRPLPMFLRIGFPRPIGTYSEGIDPGDRTTAAFEIGGQTVDLELEVVESGPEIVRYVVMADHTPVAHWMRLHGSEVRLRSLADGKTEVHWALSYTRSLDPAWYFGPIQRYGASRAAAYLIESAATP